MSGVSDWIVNGLPPKLFFIFLTIFQLLTGPRGYFRFRPLTFFNQKCQRSAKTWSP